MKTEILQVGITEEKERTWGRVFVDYRQDDQEKFAFKNWIKFEEKSFSGNGTFENEPAFTWFDIKETTTDFERVLEEEYDIMALTNANYKDQYGTPSKILRKLLSEIDQNLLDEVDQRRGWFNK